MPRHVSAAALALMLGAWTSAQEPQPGRPNEETASTTQEEELGPLLRRLGEEGIERPATRAIYRRYTPELERLFNEGDERLASLGADLADSLVSAKIAEIRREGPAYYLCFQLSPSCDAPARRLAWHIVFSPGSSVLETVRNSFSGSQEDAVAILEAIERRLWGQMRQRDPGLEAAAIHSIVGLRLGRRHQVWLTLFTRSRDLSVRVAALRGMGSFGEEHFIPESLAPRPAWFVEGMDDAVHCLAWGRPEALCAELLAELLDRAGGAQADVRLFALEGLSALGDAALDHLPRISELMRADPSHRVRDRAAALHFELNPAQRSSIGGVAMSNPSKSEPESGAAAGPGFAPGAAGREARIRRQSPPPGLARPPEPNQAPVEPNEPQDNN